MNKKEKNEQQTKKKEEHPSYGKTELKKMVGGKKSQKGASHLYHSSTTCRGK